ncbi:MAG TPA: DUF366 domain-containing protein [Bdellovibrionales bacterium]|nr:hypothetical protein [Pseudobdellovibrionaceae bacterium]HAG91989.1 DUF366 domain-containing protein [Bdellovibrionales bacterium]|tara:strand:- start:1337 stop:1903 length:567 start_codon:yes stop_codon:yes gene_type:complete
MKFKHYDQTMTYDGSQLHSLFNYLKHDMMGDSLLSFIGPCQVSLAEMVDGEDKKEKAKICSKEMLHFVVEIFHQSLFSAVCMQRLMADLSISRIIDLSPKEEAKTLRRSGDDIYLKDKKLSISVATSSPVSQLIHFAINTTTEGTPVPTISLKELEVDPLELAKRIGESVVAEYDDILAATTKVHWVK